jgi:thioredoxin 1
MVNETYLESRVGLLDSDQLFESEVERSLGWVLVDYFAEWCGPCKRFAPILDKLSTQYTNVRFFKVDVEQLEDKAEDANIQSMPTFVLYLNGKEVGRVLGADAMKLSLMLNQSEN